MNKRKFHLRLPGRTVYSCKMKFLGKGWTVSFTLLLCMLSYVLAIFDDHRCQPGQFKVISKNAESFLRCQTCYMCPPGYGVNKECSETADTVCRRCPEGSFSDSSTRRGECKQCTPCMDEYDTLQECTPNSDRVCRNPCDTGQFLNVEHRRCESCSFCHDKANVNVTRNAQCENQGLPPMWTCWPNITVTTDDEETEIVVNTGETYSYITATEKSKGHQQMFIIQLEDYVDLYLMKRAQESTSTSVTTWGVGTEGQTLPSRVSTMHETTSESPDRNHSLFSDATEQINSAGIYAEFDQSQQNCNQGLDAVVFWVVFSTFVLLICLIVAMAIIIYGYHKESHKTDFRQIQNRQFPEENSDYFRQGLLYGNENSSIHCTMSLLPPPYSSNPELYTDKSGYCSVPLAKV
ncbi:Tumor necrosis factor receptor superfamily member 16 [Holothuria leucospilota]|uniref:Tumor necrosis factor receptor superfamily member 16 n=1 Tax=Holothuria leucospilota TaxID=206669 RepID=A0A9Q1BJQ3_HOLLE|nr:Tumor necrosis factor receptor superfamily member 16 [Holothuria leucospilota]